MRSTGSQVMSSASEDDPEGVDGAMQVRREALIELDVVDAQKLRRVLGFLDAVVAKINIGPASKDRVPVSKRFGRVEAE